MSVLNTDPCSRLTAIDPTYADNAASQTTNSSTTFGNYLQWAQTQPANSASNRGSWSSLETGDALGSQTPAAYAAPPADAAAASNPSPSVGPGSRKMSNNSQSRQTSVTSSSAQPSPSTPPESTNQDASTTSQDQHSDGSQDSSSESTNQDSNQPSRTSQDHSTNKANKGDAAAVVVNLNMVAPVAANATASAGVNPAMSVQTKALPAPTAAKPGNMPNASATVNPSQTDSAATANGQAAAEQAAAETTPAAPAIPKERSATDAPTSSDSSATADSPKPSDKTTNFESMAASTAVTSTNPAAIAATTPSMDSKPPEHAAVRGIAAAPTSQTTDTLPAQVNIAAAAIPDAPLARDAPAKSVAESLGQPETDTSATAGKPAASLPSSSPAAATPQSATHGTTPATTDSNTAQTVDSSLSEADRVRFVQRVEQAFHGLSDQGGSLRLRLSPPELGSLHIEISVVKGEMTARVQAETTAARNILLDNLPALRDRLAQHDIKVQRFDVDLMERSAGGMSNQSSQYQNNSQQTSGGAVVRTPFRGSSELPGAVEIATPRPASGGGQLNVVV